MGFVDRFGGLSSLTKAKSSLITLGSAKLVSWDLDGTIYSIRRMKLELVEKLLREIAAGRGRVAIRELALLRRYRSLIEAARLIGGVLDPDISRQRLDVVGQFEKRWCGDAIRETGPRSGVIALIELLAEKNIPQVILSDYRVAYKLNALGLNKACFAATYEGESLGLIKPSPGLFEQISLDFNVPAKGIVHIGDRIDTDEVAARTAGCQCLILGRDFQNFRSLLRGFNSQG